MQWNLKEMLYKGSVEHPSQEKLIQGTLYKRQKTARETEAHSYKVKQKLKTLSHPPKNFILKKNGPVEEIWTEKKSGHKC